MGPRSEDRGWLWSNSTTLAEWGVLQWGHDPKTVDGPARQRVHPGRVASMGPRSEDRGWANCTPVLPWMLASFNGATIRRPWMDPGLVPGPARLEPASMGPRSEDRGWAEIRAGGRVAMVLLQWGHDPKTVDGARTHWADVRQMLPSFNGATIRRPWMELKKGGIFFSSHQLQWGHDPKTVDGRVCSVTSVAIPRLQWGHDPKTVDGYRPTVAVASVWMLQWGHDPKTVDGLLRCSSRPCIPPLQWGHDPKTVDGSSNGAKCSGSRGFNGATIRRPWMGFRPYPSAPRSNRFNGATIRRPWMDENDPGARGLSAASMGPRSEDRGWPRRNSALERCSDCPLQWGHDPKTVDGPGYPHWSGCG